MFDERVHGLSLALLILLIPLILMASACGDDGGEDTVPTDTPTTDGEEASPTALATSAIGAIEAYVTEIGLDGEIFEVTDPINCNAFVDVPEEDKPFGKICIDFRNSDFSETSGVIEVSAYGTEDAWEVTLELQNLSWVVTGAEKTTSEADGQ